MFVTAAMVLVVLLVTSCSRYARERKFVETVGAETLTGYTIELERKDEWKLVRSQVPKEMWLGVFVEQGVLQVKPYIAGLLIVLETKGRNERGIYVTTDKSQTPENGSGIEFEKLADGIYGFEQKIRVQYIAPEQRNNAGK